MSHNTVYLITGGNRGIGFGLTSTLLLRPNTIVVATVRSETTPTDDLKSLPTTDGSNLIILPLSSTSDTAADSLIASLPAHGITHIDTVIANAGSGVSFESSVATSLISLRDDFEVNTLGPIKLFQAANSLLKKSLTPKFILISSSLGSIGGMDESPSLSYGVSKAAANYLVRKVHIEHPEIASLAIHPGWVKTANGQNFADAVGFKEPPMTLEQSVNGVQAQIDNAKQISGSFISYNGTIIPW